VLDEVSKDESLDSDSPLSSTAQMCLCDTKEVNYNSDESILYELEDVIWLILVITVDAGADVDKTILKDQILSHEGLQG